MKYGLMQRCSAKVGLEPSATNSEGGCPLAVVGVLERLEEMPPLSNSRSAADSEATAEAIPRYGFASTS